jgi:hypothetical protein
MTLATAEQTIAPAMEMTDEQRFFFDLKGWLLIPGVLGADECEAIKAHVNAGGSTFTGPAQELLDHPALVGILNEILSDAKPVDDYYNFRCENSFPTIRSYGWKTDLTSTPHVVRPPQKAGPMSYECRGGRIWSGLTRVVWELNEVGKKDGGTLFLSGTHKAGFAFPPSALQVDSPLLESYECPAGSLFIFSESLLHAATEWKCRERQRFSIFNCYNSVWAQWHRLNLDPAIIEGMPKKRQSLFRGVYAHDFHKKQGNHEWGPDNRAL